MRTIYQCAPLSIDEKSPMLFDTDDEVFFADEEAVSIDPGPPRNGSRSIHLDQWELGKIIFILLFFVLSALSNWAVLAYTHDFAGWEPMPDIVFKFVPEIPIAHKLGDYFVTSCLACLGLLLIFHQSRLTVFRRMVFIIATLYTMRSVTLLATQLPPSYSDNVRRCRARNANFTLERLLGRMSEQAIRFGMQDEEGKLCGDMMFSGHTLVMMVCMLTVTHYLPKKLKLLGFLPYCFAYLGMVCMVISRRHYSIDVVIAHWLTSFVFTCYHAYAELDLKERRQSVLHDFAYFRLIGWLEENIANKKIDNVFVNPIDEMRRLQRPPLVVVSETKLA